MRAQGITRAAYARLFIPFVLPPRNGPGPVSRFRPHRPAVRRRALRLAAGRFRRAGRGRRGLPLCLLALGRALLVAVRPPRRRCQFQLRCAAHEPHAPGGTRMSLGRPSSISPTAGISSWSTRRPSTPSCPGRSATVDPRWNQQAEHFIPPHRRRCPTMNAARRADRGPVDRALHHAGEGVELRVRAPIPRANGSRTSTRPRTRDGGPPAAHISPAGRQARENGAAGGLRPAARPG